MKGKFKGKILNLRNIIVSLIIVVMATVSGISIVQYNSRNVQTNLGEAQTSNYQITGKELVEQALKQVGKSGIDCSGLINTALKACGGTNIQYGSSYGWNSGLFQYTMNGQNYKAEDLGYQFGYTGNQGKENTKWYSKIESPENLKIGTVISGRATEDTNSRGHVFIYLGKADTYDALKSNLKTQYDLNLPNYNSRYVDARDINGNNGGPYWYIEGNQTTNIVKIRNFSWSVNNDQNSVKNLTYIRVWNITDEPEPEPSSYSLRLSKKDRSDKSLAGAQFKVTRTNTNKTAIVNSTTGNYVDVLGLDKDGSKDIAVNDAKTVDKYTIEETTAPNGYVKNTNKLYLEVTRIFKDNEYKIYQVKMSTDKHPTGITRGADDNTTTEKIDEYTIQFHSTGKTNKVGVIAIYAINDEQPHINNYSVKLKKVDENGYEIKNATFNTHYYYTQPGDKIDNYLYYLRTDTGIGADFYNIQPRYKAEGSKTLKSGADFGVTPQIGSTDGTFAAGILATVMESKNAGKDARIDSKISNYTNAYLNYEDKIHLIDRYEFQENKISGYKYDNATYAVEITKSYSITDIDSTNAYGYLGRIVKISIVKVGTSERADTEIVYEGSKAKKNSFSVSYNNITANLNFNSNGSVNIEIQEKNDTEEGSYQVYYGKKSKYEDIWGESNAGSTEITCKNNIEGAQFRIEKYYAGNTNVSCPDEVVTETSKKDVWNMFEVKTKSLATDRFHIIETSPPSQYGEQLVKQIWMDVYKTERDNKIVVDHIEVSFRNEKGEFVKYDINNNPQGYYYNSLQGKIRKLFKCLVPS